MWNLFLLKFTLKKKSMNYDINKALSIIIIFIIFARITWDAQIKINKYYF